MRRAVIAAWALGAASLVPMSCPGATASGVNDRLTLMLSGSSLSGVQGDDDGAGFAVGWLHNFNTSTILGLGAQHHTLADSDWTFGSLNLTYGLGQADRRTNLYVEAHQGSGEDNVHSYDYGVYSAGIIQNLTRQLSVQLEDRQIEIDTTHGNLPKIGFQYVWGTTVTAALAYSHSISGNLGTRITTLRIDRYGKAVNLIVGAANGQASPAVLDLQTGITTPGLTMHEYFAGITKPFSRADVTLLGDYLKLADTERFTLTLNFTVHLRGR